MEAVISCICYYHVLKGEISLKRPVNRFIALSCICVISMLLVAGCSKDKDVTYYNYTFRDENDLWEAEYKLEGSTTFYTNEQGALDVETHHKDALIVAYKGKLQDLQGIRHVKISYRGTFSGGSMEEEYGEGKYFNSKVFKLTGGGSGAITPEDDVIKVTLQIDDWETQNLELTRDSVPGYDIMSSEHQNDLVYRDYGTGVRLSDASMLTIPQLDLNLGDATADIYAIDLEHNEVTKVCSYEPLRDIYYSPEAEGVYIILAKISNGETVDLTPEAMIETSYTGECADGFILLQ